MPRFAKMLERGMAEKGHRTMVWSPAAKVSKVPAPKVVKKWLGYIDQFLLFPRSVKKWLKTIDKETLFVITDHALGPWVPLVSKHFHVIHCHDFLAQRSALDEIVGRRTGFTGKLYQKMIRKGYSKGDNFISVSKKTQVDLHRFLKKTPAVSEVVYNGMNRSFGQQDSGRTRNALGQILNIELSKGYLLHVGGNQWYKNRFGILEIYEELCSHHGITLPLLLVGEHPEVGLQSFRDNSPFQQDIHFLTDCDDEIVRDLYAGASLLLYPSYEEGFGWPIAEAMASGCPVVTTQKAPMTEVAGIAGVYIPARPLSVAYGKEWAIEAAKVVKQVLSLPEKEREDLIDAGIENAKRFDQKKALDAIEDIYAKILEKEDSE